MAEGDIEINVEEEPGGGTTIVQPNGAAPGGEAVVDKTDKETGSVDEGVAELQRKLDESERARIAAEQRANEAQRRIGNAEATVIDSRMAVITGALDTIEANLTTLETQHEEALAAGNFKAATQAARQMAAQEAQKVELQRGKAALEAQARQPRQPTGQLDDNAKVELYVQTLQPRAAAWVRAHPDYVTDPRKNARMLSQHHAALADGLTEGSDDYFKAIEIGLGLTTGTVAPAPAANGATHGADNGANNGGTGAPLSGAAAPTQRRGEAQPSPAAPSRGGGGTRTVRLTPAQQEAARMSGLSNEEYARNMVREEKAGNIGKTRVH